MVNVIVGQKGSGKTKELIEAIQSAVKNENGDIKKITCLEALASKTIADAISKDGPTRRLLYRQDLMNLVSKEPEMEYSPDQQKMIDVENKYGKLLLQWAETDPDIREKMSRIISEALINLCNEKSIREEDNE